MDTDAPAVRPKLNNRRQAKYYITGSEPVESRPPWRAAKEGEQPKKSPYVG